MLIDEEVKKKYEFILKPIKDLTKNWEVDVSHILEEYMEEIEKMSFSVDNGNTVVNFAEASMLIQGTACVWSRKVEYLYQLVQKTLDMITSKQSGCSSQKQQNASTTEEANFDNDSEKLLDLDDVTITSERLMKGGFDPVLSIPLPPPSLQELDADERGRMVITEDKADTICYSNDFWENRYIPFKNKPSVLDRDSNGVLHKILISNTQDLSNSATVHKDIHEDFVREPDPHDDSMASIPVAAEIDCENFPSNDCHNSGVFEEENVVPRRMQLRSQAPKLGPTVLKSEDMLPRLLDPYEECKIPSWTDKIYHKFKSYRLPVSLLKKERKRKHDGTILKEVETVHKFLSKPLKKDKSAVFHESPLLEIAMTELKVRSSLWKLIKKEANALDQGVVDEESAVADRCNDDDDDDNDMADFPENPSQEDFIGVGDFPPDLNDVAEGIIDNRDAYSMSVEATEQPASSYEDLVRHHVEMFYSSAQRYKEETALAQRVKTWNDVVVPRLEEQAQRPQFDIHNYGDIILKKFAEAPNSKRFIDIVETSDTWNICRLFAATLQLVNDQNFSVSKNDSMENSINSMELTLLSQRRLHNRFDQCAIGS